jgi:hypothetical protein
MEPFLFYTKLDQTILLGVKARNSKELLAGIISAPKSSIYYHTHRYLLQHHYLSPEPPNDFAYWVSNMLGDTVLGELLFSIDIIRFGHIEELRENLVDRIKAYLDSNPPGADCHPGHEFHFMASQTFAFPTCRAAGTLRDFGECLRKVSVNSLYYHFFDAKLRLEKGDNDFSCWFDGLGYPELAREVRRLDPYTQTLEGLRNRLITLVERYDTH